MTVSASGSTHGAVSVTPDRLLTFSRAKIVAASTVATGDATRYRFRINPDRISIRHEILEKYTLTQLGYERQDWGNGLSTFQYSGNTGVFRPDVTAAVYAQTYPNGFDIRKTTAWLRFKEFETFYRTRGKNVFMYYTEYDHEWEGSLSGFSFDKTANLPFHLTYSFTFTGMPIDYAPTTTTVATATDAQAAAAEQSLLSGQSSFL